MSDDEKMTPAAAESLILEITNTGPSAGTYGRSDIPRWAVEAVRRAHAEGVSQGRRRALDDVAHAIRKRLDRIETEDA